MKRLFLLLFIIIFLPTASSADSLSTSHTIRIQVRVVANPELEDGESAVDSSLLDENKNPEASPAAEPLSKPPQTGKSSEIGRSIRNVFFSLIDPREGMHRKY